MNVRVWMEKSHITGICFLSSLTLIYSLLKNLVRKMVIFPLYWEEKISWEILSGCSWLGSYENSGLNRKSIGIKDLFLLPIL